uniref:Odorant receptor n=1 Tax=Streltzoviella insularis TaxID=1206366 RepID=A0A7D5YTS0_9NEOP|nr:odorant receptor 21 [Streltzoviella insularis]
MEEKLAYYSLVPHFKQLRQTGFYPLDPEAPKLQKFLQKLYNRFSVSLLLLYTTQQIINLYQWRRNINKIMDSMFLFLTYCDCLIKEAAFWNKADEIKGLMNIMKGPIYNQKEHKQILIRTVRQAKLVLRIFNIMCLITCLLWAIFPVIFHLRGRVVEFGIWLPFDSNENPQFYFVVIYVCFQTSWLAFNNSTMDVTMAFFLAQCTTQFFILRQNLENIVKKSIDDSTTLRISFAKAFEKRFIGLMQHYNDIVQSSQKIEEIFGNAVFVQFIFTGWIICTTAYRMINMSPGSIEFLSMILYILCVMTQPYLYCFYGNELMYESDKLMNSAYAMDWLMIAPTQRRYLIIFMERIKRPIQPKAGFVIPLSANTFLTILRTSYTFYAFLKNSY